MTGRFRPTVVALVVAIGVAALFVSPAGRATADGPEGAVLISPDGRTWSADLPAPLFDPSLRWVPGDTRTSSFYVENRGASPAEVGLKVSAADGGSLLGTGDVLLRARVAGGPWEAVPGEIGEPLDSVAVGVGESRRIDVRAVLRAASSNLSQTASVALSFVVQLTEKAPSPGTIPATGAPELRGLLFLAALCVGTGLALVRRTAGSRRG